MNISVFSKVLLIEGVLILRLNLYFILVYNFQTPATNKNKNSPTFKSSNIFPTRQDFFISEPASRSQIDTTDILKYIQISPAINKGAYQSVEHYLDVQFRLLREDYFGPLREGICW